MGQGTFVHADEVGCLEAYVDKGSCCALVGLSNTGKSTVLRALCRGHTQALTVMARAARAVYIDFNQMVDLSEQGFYEAILRAVCAHLEAFAASADVGEALDLAYHRVVEPPNPFAIPVGFAQGMERLCEGVDAPLVLVMDEFDEPFIALDGRVFLNLRALRDRFGSRLVYVVGVERALEDLRKDEATAEFRELFAGHVCTLGMEPDEGTARWVREMGLEGGVELTREEVDFVLRQAGGHPGLVRAVTRLLVRARTLAPETYRRMGTDLVEAAVPTDAVVQAENERIWNCLTAQERQAFVRLVRGESLARRARDRLVAIGLLDDEGVPFGEAFVSFVRDRSERRGDVPHGLWVDEESGDAYLDGRRLPTLSDLEFRLLKALYDRKGQLCDRYYLVETVWGESYIDEVDDARIDKLVSRLRLKLEPDPSNPRYLVTVRGRGYRLQDQ